MMSEAGWARLGTRGKSGGDSGPNSLSGGDDVSGVAGNDDDDNGPAAGIAGTAGI